MRRCFAVSDNEQDGYVTVINLVNGSFSFLKSEYVEEINQRFNLFEDMDEEKYNKIVEETGL